MFIINWLRIYYPVTIVLSIEKIMIMCNKLKGETILGKYTRKGRGWCKKRRFTKKKKKKKERGVLWSPICNTFKT